MGYPAPLKGRNDASDRPPQVDEFRRNRWTVWIGIAGRIPSELVDGLRRNQWTDSAGICTQSSGLGTSLSWYECL